MHRTKTTIVVAGSALTALVALLAIVIAFGAGNTNSAEAAQLTPTPFETNTCKASTPTPNPSTPTPHCVIPTATPPKTPGTDNLSGVFDLTAVPAPLEIIGPASFHCISRVDHYPDDSIKNAIVCYIDQPGLGTGLSAVPDPPGLDQQGPPPPPPYGGGEPSKGEGTYTPGSDTSVQTNCFENIGGSLGPHVIAVATIPDAKANLSNSVDATVDIYFGQDKASCNALTPAGTPTFDDAVLQLHRIQDDTGALDSTGCNASTLNDTIHGLRDCDGANPLDYDGDGCDDADELDKTRQIKNCGDDPYNPYDSDLDFNGVYNLTVTVIEADREDPGGDGAEVGAECGNAVGADASDDGFDYWVNDGCPAGGASTAETGAECAIASKFDDDNDGKINDGCPTVGSIAETGAQCDNDTSDDGADDGPIGSRAINDGCPVAGPDGETPPQCENSVDDDGDTLVNDGCPAKAIIPGSYFDCIAEIEHDKGTNALIATAYCYTDNPLTTTNPQDAGGAVCRPIVPAPVGLPKKFCGDGLSGAQPPGAGNGPAVAPYNNQAGLPMGDVDASPHVTFKGWVDKTANILHLEGCYDQVETAGLGPNVYVRVDLDAHTLQGTTDIWPARGSCAKPPASELPEAGDFKLPTSASEQEPDWDTDRDGCTNAEELDPGVSFGGRRDPFSENDRGDVNHVSLGNGFSDGFITVSDILAIAGQFGAVDQSDPVSVLSDDGFSMTGSNSWNRRSGDLTVTITDDILGTAQTFGHNCNGVPGSG